MASAFANLPDALIHSLGLEQSEIASARSVWIAAGGPTGNGPANTTFNAAYVTAGQHRLDRDAAARAAFIGTAAAIPATAKPGRAGAVTWLSNKVDNGS